MAGDKPIISNAGSANPNYKGASASGGGTTAAGSYGSDGGGAFTDPNTGQVISGAGNVPTKTGIKTISALILGARQPKNLSLIRNQLIANGIISKGTKSLASIQNAWLQVVLGSSTAQLDPEEYMKQLKAGGFGQDTAAAGLPTKQIYNYSTAEIKDLVNESALSLLGREINKTDENADWYKSLTGSINKMIQQGTITKTTQKGGMNVVETTPGFTKEKATSLIQSKLKSEAPIDLARKERVDFTSWLFDQLGTK